MYGGGVTVGAFGGVSAFGAMPAGNTFNSPPSGVLESAARPSPFLEASPASVVPGTAAPFKSATVPPPASHPAAVASPFISQALPPPPGTKPPPQLSPMAQVCEESFVAEEPPSLAVASVEDDDELQVAPDKEITSIEEAKEELMALQHQTVDLARKWEDARAQLARQLRKEADVLQLVADAEAEVERLRMRIPKAYDNRLVDATDMEQAMSIQVEAATSLPAPPPPKIGPRRGVLGMEVSSQGDFVRVHRLTPGGACQLAGLVVGDIIRTWSGKLVTNLPDFTRVASVCGAGIPLNVEVQRDGVKGLLTFEVIPKRKT